MDFESYLASKMPNYEILSNDQLRELRTIFDELQAYDIAARSVLHKQFNGDGIISASDYANSMELRSKIANRFDERIKEFCSIKKGINDENYHI